MRRPPQILTNLEVDAGAANIEGLFGRYCKCRERSIASSFRLLFVSRHVVGSCRASSCGEKKKIAQDAVSVFDKLEVNYMYSGAS